MLYSQETVAIKHTLNLIQSTTCWELSEWTSNDTTKNHHNSLVKGQVKNRWYVLSSCSPYTHFMPQTPTHGKFWKKMHVSIDLISIIKAKPSRMVKGGLSSWADKYKPMSSGKQGRATIKFWAFLISLSIFFTCKTNFINSRNKTRNYGVRYKDIYCPLQIPTYCLMPAKPSRINRPTS